jgi:ABC-type transport system involved in multi-copper enzyme maturation permease subunit
MIGALAKKDFLTNLVAPRFLIGFVLCLVLIPFSIVINISSYRERTAQYRIDRDAAEKAAAEVRVYSALRPEIVLPPEPLSIFGKGVSDQVGNRVKILLGEKPLLAEGKTAAGDNPFLASFFSVDFVDIAAIVFSLLALLFSYDAFSREKEDGTLKLQMANSLGRSTVLAGKLLGILATLLPVLVFSFLLSGLLVLFSRDISFDAADWGRIAVLFGASLVYLAVFVFIGLVVSTRTKSSVTSLVVCLFLWVLLVFVVPAIASNFAGSFVGAESRDNLDRVLRDIDRQREEAISAAFKAQGIPQGWSCRWCWSGEDGRMETYGNTRDQFENFRRRAAISEPIRLDYAEREWAPAKAYLDSLARQAQAAERLSFASPAGLFRAVASAVCRTDLAAHQRQLDRTRQYREVFVRWLRAKDIFASFRWITPADPSTFKTEDQMVEARTGGEFKNVAELDAWASKQSDAMARWQKLSKVHVPGDLPDDFPYLELSDMPRYEARARSLVTGPETSILWVGIMLVEAVFLFALGYVAFIRYDVR